MPVSPEVVTLRAIRLWLDDEGIVHGQALPDIDTTLADCEAQMAEMRRLLGGRRPAPFLMDIRNARSLSREARMYVGGPEGAAVIAAAALLIDSPLSRAIGNFFLGLNRTRMPTRLFTSEADARVWLRRFR